jgi:alpha-ketoglutarate-dependent 2,4-dichlorophenoxyacetate dioxygenase
LTVGIRQLRHGFAGQVMGVDCREPLSSGDVAAIHAGMNDYAVLVFRDQKLSDEEQLRFTLHFGTLEETRGGTPGPIHFRTEHEVRKFGPSIKDFSNIDASGKPLATDSRARGPIVALRQFVQRCPGILFVVIRPLRSLLGRQHRICRHASGLRRA